MQDRPNYYLLLDLDPSVNDWPAIETRLREKKRQWSLEKTQGNPAFQRKAAHNLSISREIEETLKNPETREQEAKEARKLQEQARQSKLKELDEGIQLLRADNQCTREQLALLVKQFGGAISEKDIEARIRKAGIRIAESKSGGSGPLPFKERIEQTLSNSIKSNLDVLKLDNLYKFLGLNPRSSPRVLCETANAINKEILKIGLTDPESSARKELAGLCLALFRDEKEKEKYDNTIALEAMDQLKNSIELVGKDGFISLSEMDGLVKLARSRGVQPADARAHIEEYARKRKWGFQSEKRSASATESMGQLEAEIELRGGDMRITLKEMDELVKRARELGILLDDARAYVEDYARQRKWTVQSDAKSASGLAFTRRLRVFLCHASCDKNPVRDLYGRLLKEGIAPWLDEEDLLPGQQWEMEIRKSVRESDAVIVCLSKASINKTGFVHREIKYALDVAEEHPEGTIFIIPLKLEECDLPDRLQRYHWVSIFESNGYDKLLRSLNRRHESLLRLPTQT